MLAQHDVELTEDDWETIKYEWENRTYDREEEAQPSIETSEDKENYEDSKICPEKMPLTLRC